MPVANFPGRCALAGGQKGCFHCASAIAGERNARQLIMNNLDVIRHPVPAPTQARPPLAVPCGKQPTLHRRPGAQREAATGNLLRSVLQGAWACRRLRAAPSASHLPGDLQLSQPSASLRANLASKTLIPAGPTELVHLQARLTRACGPKDLGRCIRSQLPHANRAGTTSHPAAGPGAHPGRNVSRGSLGLLRWRQRPARRSH